MSLSGSYSLTIQANGITVIGNADRTGTQSIDNVDTTLAIGHAGSLTTRTSDTAGVVTLTAGHDITTGVVDIHWDGGCRYNMGGTISDTNTLTLVIGDSGGDVLPDQDTAVVATPPETLDTTFDGDNLTLIGVGASRQTSIRFFDTDDTIVGSAILLVAGGAWGWAEDIAITNPLTGNPITYAEASNGDAVYTSALKITGLQY
jgi:hypothetical protein